MARQYEEDKDGSRGEGRFSGCKPPLGLSFTLPEPLSPADPIGLTLGVLHIHPVRSAGTSGVPFTACQTLASRLKV